MNLILSLLLAIVTAFSAASAALLPDDTGEQAAVPALSESYTLPEPETAGRGVDYEDMAYVHFDAEPFYDGVDRLYALADGGDGQAVCELYDSLYGQYLRLDAMEGLAYIQYAADTRSAYWSEEYNYTASLLSECADSLCGACRYVLKSACARQFAGHVGEDAAAVYLSYVSATEREAELYDQELALISQYYALLDGAESLTYSYLGRDWTADMIYGYEGQALAASDYDGYLEVWYGLQQVQTELLAPTYGELVRTRGEIAALAGYDSYTDYAYETLYGRDYSADDAQALCDAVKPIARQYYDNYYYSDLWYAYDAVTPVMDGQALLDTLGRYAVRLDASLAEPWSYMTAHGLYDLGEGDGRMDGAFTAEIALYESPFIFQTLSGTCYDFITLSHEFGHYANAYFSPTPNILTTIDSYDLLEIHSNGLQALLTGWYDEIFDSGARTAEFINLADLLENVIEGCIYDEFQRRVFESAEPLTAEALNSLYVSVCAQYGLYGGELPDWDCAWVYVPHNFERPLYYISYAASALAALQLWDMAQTDRAAAVEAYKAVLGQGAHDKGYFQVLEACGLRLFTEDGAAADICAPVLARLKALDH